MRFPLIALACAPCFALPALAAEEEAQTLTVYTYDSFVSEWGPGPAVEEAFEAVCACDLNFVGVGDGAALLARVRLEGERTRADVVLGLDTNLTAEAAATGLFAQHEVLDVAWDLPVVWEDDMFVPYDWGYFAFVHEAAFDPPGDFRDLASSDASILIQDPRSSTPGLGLLLWVEAAYGEAAPEIWAELADNVVTVTKGWSEAYGLFLDGEADMVLSYTTSPAYHLIAEGDDSKRAAPFAEGHYMQIEVAGAVASSPNLPLAQSFLRFLATDPVQSVLPTTNWMYPAVTPEGGLPEGFETLIAPERALLYPAGQVPEIKAQALDTWLGALSR
ncbi:thiamine ABC transporter substrate binding subunit [Rhodobacteraceae bacterium CCMM004]|nr:thiamine ABC transporter substrate binding subunit [Rhodobacteraceae bacterium CCMM004]